MSLLLLLQQIIMDWRKKKKTLFSIVLGAGKLKFYVQADLAFDEGSPSSLQMAAFLLIFPWWTERKANFSSFRP